MSKQLNQLYVCKDYSGNPRLTTQDLLVLVGRETITVKPMFTMQDITMQDILKNPDKPWDWEWISSNPVITMQDVLDHPDKPWNWCCIGENPNITMQYILDHSDKPWDLDGILLFNTFPLQSVRKMYSSRINTVQDMTCPFTGVL